MRNITDTEWVLLFLLFYFLCVSGWFAYLAAYYRSLCEHNANAGSSVRKPLPLPRSDERNQISAEDRQRAYRANIVEQK